MSLTPDTLAAPPRAAPATLPTALPGVSTAATLPTAEVSAEKVQALVAQLQTGSLAAIHAFGRDIGQHTAQHTDALAIDHTRPAFRAIDLQENGDLFTTVAYI